MSVQTPLLSLGYTERDRSSGGDGTTGRELSALGSAWFDAWFFEVAGDGMHLPSPSRLVASQQFNRWLKRGGLSFGSAGWARSAARGCRAAVRRWFTRRGTCCEAREWAQKVGLHSHRRHGRTCMPMPQGDDKTSHMSRQKTDRMSSMFGSGVQ